MWLERGTCTTELKVGVPSAVPNSKAMEVSMTIIGVDPHKASHTAVAISDAEEELDRKKVRSGGA